MTYQHIELEHRKAVMDPESMAHRLPVPQRNPLSDLSSTHLNQLHASVEQAKKRSDLFIKEVPSHDKFETADLTVGAGRVVPRKEHLSQISAQELTEEHTGRNKRFPQVLEYSNRSSFSPRLKRFVGPWELGKDLGKGMSGKVRKARHRESSLTAAVKIINIRKASKLQTSSVLAIDKQLRSSENAFAPLDKVPVVLQREIVILKAIEHPNVIKLFDIWENRGDLYLFTEFVQNGELFYYVTARRCLGERESVRIFRQIISGLQYCHRFRLCHRDMKLENILMDHNYNVKLADFGMAAMHNDQPLRTACGSPHYAAPEIVRGRPYRGDISDIWSCGIILYVMMRGKLPFGGEYDADRVPKICQEILSAPLDFSASMHPFSDASKDLIRRILERDPLKRISIPEMWCHPLLTKYEKFAQDPQNRKYWLGGPAGDLTEEDCGEQLSDIRDIDRAILKGLCILWQTGDEDHFVKALLGSTACYEKVLYNCLHRYRIEQEENYRGPALETSASDFHHVAPRHIKRIQTKASLLGPGSPQPHSQYSIVLPGSHRPSFQSRRTGRSNSGIGSDSKKNGSLAGTETTYDPYRSSKPQVVYRGDPYTKVAIYRGSSIASTEGSRQRVKSSRHAPVSSVWESTIGSSLASIPSSPPAMPLDANGQTRTLRRTTVKRIRSKSSLASSVASHVSDQSVHYCRSSSHKRNVTFNRIRNQPPRPSAPTPVSIQQRYLHDRLQEVTPPLPSSPGNRQGSIGKSMPDLKGTVGDMGSSSFNKSSRAACSSTTLRDSHASQKAADLAGSELSQYCDAAFSSSPVPSASGNDFQKTPISMSGATDILSTPVARSVAASKTANASLLAREILNRPLPELPIREPQTLQVQRALAKSLRNLKWHEKQIGQGRLENVMNEIERAMRLNAPGIAADNYARRLASDSRRVLSEGYADHHPQISGHLNKENEIGSDLHSSQRIHGRYFSDPLPRLISTHDVLDPIPPEATIRLVPRSPGVPHMTVEEATTPARAGVASGQAERINEPRVVPRRRDSKEFSPGNDGSQDHNSVRRSSLQIRLNTIQEVQGNESEDVHSKRESNGNKFRSWFRRSNSSTKSLEETPDKNITSKTMRRNLTDQTVPKVENCQDQGSSAIETLEASCVVSEPEFPYRSEAQKATRGFWDFFRREKRCSMELVELGEAESLGAASSMGSQRRSHVSSSAFGMPQPGAKYSPYPSLLQSSPQKDSTNWLARLLQVRPATHILAFEVSSTRMLREIRGIFRDWQKYGVRDIVCEKSTGRIWARVTNENNLSVKPVEILVEVFGVVYSGKARQQRAGKPGGMSIAHMQQLRGAKSSFEQCANQLEKLCRERALLTTEKKKSKEMKKCLNEWRK